MKEYGEIVTSDWINGEDNERKEQILKLPRGVSDMSRFGWCKETGCVFCVLFGRSLESSHLRTELIFRRDETRREQKK